MFAAGDEEAGRTHGSGPWQGVKQREVGMVLGALRNSGIEVGNGLQSDAEFGNESLHQENIGVMTPSSVVSAMALLRAWRRVSMTSTERTW